MKQLLLATTLLTGTAFAAAPATSFPPVPGEEKIKFDRTTMSEYPTNNLGYLVEGYWNDAANKYPQYSMPVAGKPWVGQEEFLLKLKLIEFITAHKDIFDAKGMDDNDGQNGTSLSRITGEVVGSEEYKDHTQKIVWPYGLRQHYFEKHHVLPSRDFYRYVHAKAAEFGATNMAETETVMKKFEAMVTGKNTADGLLPWNDPVQQQRIVTLLATLLPTDRTACPQLQKWCQQVLPRAESLCPELAEEHSEYWFVALRVNSALTQKYCWLFPLMTQFVIKKTRAYAHAHKEEKQLCMLYQDYK